MKHSQCAAFVAIADAGSFTKAARALGVSQSAVSHAIAGLEADLGVALMTRDRGGVDFTDAGRRILIHARAVLEHAERMWQEADAMRSGLGHTFRVGTSQSFGVRLLPRVLTEVRARFPHLEIDLREGTDAQITGWLLEHAIDVGVVTLPKQDLGTVSLLRDEMHVVLPVAHELAARERLRVADLDGETLIMPIGAVEPMLRTVFGTMGVKPVVEYRVGAVSTLLAMVAEGHGVTVLPSLALPTTPPDVRVLAFAPGVTRQIGLGVRTGGQDSPAVAEFVTIARKLAGLSDWSRVPASRAS